MRDLCVWKDIRKWDSSCVLKKMGFRRIRGERRIRKNEIRGMQPWAEKLLPPCREKSGGIISKQDITAEIV